MCVKRKVCVKIMEKITKRNMFEALINLATTGDLAFATADGNTATVTAEDLIAFAENEIALLDKKAVKAKERAATKKAEADELTDAVRAVLTDEFQTIAEVAAQIEGEDVTVARVQYRLTQLAKNGEAERGELNVPVEGGKAIKRVGFKRV